ncbi:MAG TPA: hypothetical protein GX738_00950 [Firmicutes bacterium]|nr:hypothetical protein [Bacillota bacterium]
MRFAQIDTLAVKQHSFLHAWPAGPKLAAGLVLLFGIVAAKDLMQVALFLGLLLGALVLARLPLWLLSWVLYPAFFSLPFALSQLPASPAQATVVVGKAAAAALLLIMLLASTPFPLLFGMIGRLLPRLVVDALFFSYRLFFISLRSLENLLLSLRQRGAFAEGNGAWSCWSTLQAIGYLTINTIAASQRLEQNYRLRGYETGIYVGAIDFRWRGVDSLLLALLVVAVGGVLWFG